MVAVCVTMTIYSLARLRHNPPSGTFWVGGEYLEANRKPFVRDFNGAVRLMGDEKLFAHLQTGDLILCKVSGNANVVLSCTEARKLKSAISERPRPRGHAVEFAKFVDQVRSYFKSRGLCEVFTPTLVTCPGLEPSLEAFETKVTRGREAWSKYLPTSPEIHLKKALAMGLSDIFEIRPCFRRGEFSEHHANEFYMLEWYRMFADLDLILVDLAGLLTHLKGPQLEITDFAELFQEIFGFKLTPKTDREELRQLALAFEVETSPTDSFADLFHRLMIEKIEPALASRGPTVVRRFPPSMAALARIDEKGWADRFELYWNGFEIANAFNEVTDPDEQIARWNAELTERRRLGTGELPMDLEMIEALRMGIGPTGGIALGMERLYMALYAVTDIKELTLF